MVHIESKSPNQQAVIRTATEPGETASYNPKILTLKLSRGRTPVSPLRGIVRERHAVVPTRVRHGNVHRESKSPRQQAVTRIATEPGETDNARITPPTIAKISRGRTARRICRNKSQPRNKIHLFDILLRDCSGSNNAGFNITASGSVVIACGRAVLRAFTHFI